MAHKIPDKADGTLVHLTERGIRDKVGRWKAGRWVFDKDIGKKGDTRYAYGIAICPNRSLIVADNAGAGITIFDQEGHLKQKIKDNVSLPNDISITPSEFYVADTSPYVKMFRHDGNYVMQFPAISPDGKASYTDGSDGSELWGIATDNDGNILVGNLARKYISKHRPDGTHISSFAISIEPLFLRVTSNGSIVVTSFSHDVPPQILDSNGTLLHTINKPTDARRWCCPAGIACSGEGSIFIANSGDGIYHFTEDGDYVGRVIQGMFWATGLDIYDDTLVIAQAQGFPIKMYKYMDD